MNQTSKPVVTAAELVRSFPQWREQARQDAVIVSNHGRHTHVLVGIEIWEQLHTAIGSAAAAESTDSQATVFEFADWIDDAVILCDDQLNVLFANRVAHAICRRPAKSLAGRPLNAALPEIEATLLDVHMRRTMVASEPSAADIPSPFTPGSWLRIQTFPLGRQNVIVFRDITEDVQRHRMADVKATILDTMVGHGAIGYVRLSVRATIDRVEGCFADMLGLPVERLSGLALADIADKSSRAELRKAIEEVLANGVPRRIEAGFLGNDGEVRVMTVAMNPLHGAYGGEGAICLMTPA